LSAENNNGGSKYRKCVWEQKEKKIDTKVKD
jgi:hypothetical protein